MEDTRLGAILLDCRVVPERDLQHCLEIQALTGGTRPLGQILVEQGVITQRTLDDLLQLQEARRSMESSRAVVEGTDCDRYLRAAVNVGANELHLSAGGRPIVRVAGQLQTLGDERIDALEVAQFVRNHMGNDSLDEVALRRSVTREFCYEDLARGRITAFRHFEGLAVALQMHPAESRPQVGMDVDSDLAEAVRCGKGLMLVVGERGGGITETLGAIVQHVASEAGRYVLVLDRTFEYPVPHDGAIIVRRRVGEHTQSYATGLRAALREDPDVIVVGETDAESFNLALHAAESGSLVIAAVHGRSSVTALQRVLRFYPGYDEARIRSTLAAVLIGILAVRLVPDAEHSGLVLATEVLRFDDAVRDLVRIGSLRQVNSLIRMDGANGHSMDWSLLQLLERGRVRFEDVFPFAEDKTLLLQSHHGLQARIG